MALRTRLFASNWRQVEIERAYRAIALCLIGQLVADIHQPCHAGSLYMEGVFAESDGDRGAIGVYGHGVA